MYKKYKIIFKILILFSSLPHFIQTKGKRQDQQGESHAFLFSLKYATLIIMPGPVFLSHVDIRWHEILTLDDAVRRPSYVAPPIPYLPRPPFPFSLISSI